MILSEQLKRVSPPLAKFVTDVAPQLNDEVVDIRRPKSIPKSRNYMGRCYLFSYLNPVTKEQLKYYHIYPMVILLEQDKDTMLGLNPFYIPPKPREHIVNLLIDKLNNDIEDDAARTKATYRIMTKYRKTFRYAFPCIKRYSHKRMSKVAIEMPPSLWEEFYLGDVSDKQQLLFKKASPKTVWADSRRRAIEEGRKGP